MDKALQIEQALLNLDGIPFENLIEELCSNIFKCSQIEHPGKMDGSNKPAKSKIDIWFETLSNDKKQNYFVLATTDKQFLPKIESDIDKAIDYICNTGNYQNPHIIYAINRTIEPKIANKYILLCKNYGIGFCFFGLGTVKNYLLNKFPYLAELYLGISMSNGTIVPLSLFKKNNEGSNDYSQTFMFREKETQEIIDTLLIDNKKTVIYGRPGCGKTKLALEVAEELNNRGFSVFVSKNSSSSIINDIKATIPWNKESLLIVDDANKYAFINDLFNVADQFEHLHILLTVRDYAFEQFKERTDNRFISQIKITPLSNEQIKAIIEKNYPNIKNPDFIKYILEISKGNLRFAIIATKVMLGENKQYKKLSEVVQSFYKGLEKELDFNSNEDYSNFVAALSFFGTIDIDGDDTVDLLSKVFKFKKDNIAKHISSGYEKEIINISEDGKIIEITDQVFAAYLCYKSIYINRTLSFKEIFVSFFDEHQEYKGKVVNLVQDIIDIYYPDNKQIEEDLKSILDSLVIKADINGTITFLSRFYQLFPEESINYSYQYLLNEHTKNETLQSNLISLLFKNFNDKKYYKTIIDKYISLLLRCPNIKNVLVQGITQNVNISRKSLRNDYASEIYFVEEIIQNNITDNDVLSSLINCLISYEREEYESNKSKSVMLIHFTVIASKGFQSLREKMWIIIERLINNGCFDSISHKYHNNSYFLPNDTYELRKIDLEFALKAINKIDLCHMKNKMLAIEILRPFRKMKKAEECLKAIYNSSLMVIYRDYIDEFSSVKLFGYDLQDSLKAYLLSNYKNFDELFELLIDINNIIGKYNRRRIDIIVDVFFEVFKEKNSDGFDKYLFSFLNKCDVIDFNLVSVFSLINEKKDFYSRVVSSSLATNAFIMTPLFLVLSIDDINKEIEEKAFSFFISDSFFNKKFYYGNESVVNLKNYDLFDSGFLYRLCLKYSEFNHCGHPFLEKLLYVEETPENLMQVFNSDLELFSNIYFNQVLNNKFYDSDLRIGCYLCKQNNSLFQRCLEILLENVYESRQIAALYPDKRFIKTFIKLLINKTKYSIVPFFYSHAIEQFPKDLYINLLNTYISLHKNSKDLMFVVSSAIRNRSVEDRILFLKMCLDNDVSIDILKSIYIMEGPSSWSGNYSTQLKYDLDALKDFAEETKDKYSMQHIVFLKKKIKSLEEVFNKTKANEINKDRW